MSMEKHGINPETIAASTDASVYATVDTPLFSNSAAILDEKPDQNSESDNNLNYQALLRQLPRLDGVMVDDWNTILTHSSGMPLIFEFPDGQNSTLRLKSQVKSYSLPDFSAEVIIKLRLGGHLFVIGLQHFEAFNVLRGPNAELLPREIKCAIIEGYLEHMLNHAEQMAGPAGVVDVIFNPIETNSMDCILSWEMVTAPNTLATDVYLGCDAKGLKWLAGVVKKHKPVLENNRVDGLKLPTAFCLATPPLKASQIADLSVLDIIVIGDCLVYGEKWLVAMSVCGSIVFSGELDIIKRTYTVTEIVRRPMDNENINQTQQENTETDVEAQVDMEPKNHLEDINVEMVFEIGRKHLSLGFLKDIRPGHVINMTDDLKSPVRVHVGGQPFARGQIIQIDGNLGVRLLEIYSTRDTDV